MARASQSPVAVRTFEQMYAQLAAYSRRYIGAWQCEQNATPRRTTMIVKPRR
jgi:hypothetical protein